MRLGDLDALADVIEGTDWYHLTEIGTMAHGAVSGDNAWFREGDIFKALAEAPTIDAVPVVHSRWEKGKAGREKVCHVCGSQRPFRKHEWKNPKTGKVSSYPVVWDSNYCPNCGARMDGDDGVEAD